MRKFFLLLTMIILAYPTVARSNDFTEEDVLQILTTADNAVLYSLEPSPSTSGKKLHRFLILGQIKLDKSETQKATNAFKNAISTWKNEFDGVSAACFDPRHALRVVTNGHTYDFLLCYQCLQLEVFKDDISVTWLGAAGSPDVLNGMLVSAGIPLSETGK